jgi:transglutaminase-like putative cysteine protease
VNSEDLRTSVVAALATLLGACALRPVYATGRWFPPVLAVVLLVLAGGLLLRGGAALLWPLLSRGRPAPERLAALGVMLVPLGQLALVTCLFSALYAPEESLLGVLPTPSSLTEVARVLGNGAAEVREQAPPALPLTGLVALTTLLVAFVAIIVDLIAVAGRQAGVAALGLLVLYCVPVGTISGGIGLTAVALPAAGVALLLWTDQHRRLATRERVARSTGLRPGTGTVAAARVGFTALLCGLVIGTVVPTLAEGSLATGLGGGAGGSTGTSLDPVAELRGELTLPQPRNLFRLESSVDDPSHLRAVALDQYNGDIGWTLSNLDGENSIDTDRLLAPLPAGESRRTVHTTIDVLDQNDRFLPVPFSPQRVRIDGGGESDWRFDPATGTIFGRGVSTSGLTYTVDAAEPRPTIVQLTAADYLPPDDPIQSLYTALPQLDPSVTDLVTQLVGDAATPYQRVRNILEYLTDRDNGFIYSLSTAPGTSTDDLVNFLRLKRGYCEQYAGAMAVLVRAAQVPARVVLGYTPGSEQSDGSRLITTDDAHAWVEVYFSGLGWVPFDPTPIAIDRAVDLPWAPRAGTTTPVDTGTGVSEPTAAPRPNAPREDRGSGPVPTAPSGGGGAGPLRSLVVGGIGVVAIALLLAVPAGARMWQRRRRIGAGDAGALWDELAATALDVGLRPHPSWTPRQAARELARSATPPGTEPDHVVGDAIARLARAEEAASYGPAGRGTAGPELVAALRTARRGLLSARTPRARLRARVWPASLGIALRGRLTDWAGRRPPLLGGPHRVRTS